MNAAEARVRGADRPLYNPQLEVNAEQRETRNAGQERAFRNGNHNTYGAIGLTFSIPLYVRNNFRAEVEAASVAILGLIPMLLSSGVGAETQRPLASVVVGGLITSPC